MAYMIEGPWASAGINVKSPAYGAIGDGVADDTAALQAAINDASSAHTSVYLPAGTYAVSSTISIPAGEGLSIFGAGWGTRIQLKANKNCYIFQMTGADTRITMRDLTIDGNCLSQGTLGSSGGINALGAIACRFDNVHFTACRDDALYLGGMSGGSFGHNNRVIGCLFDNSTGSTGPGRGLTMSSSTENQIIGCDFETLGGSGGTGTGTAVHILDLAGFQTVSECNFVGGGTNAAKGIRIQTVGSTQLLGCTFDSLGGDAVFIAAPNCTATSNTIFGVGALGTAGTASGIRLESGAINNVVQGNTIRSAPTNGAGRSLIREESTGGTGSNNIQGNTLIVSGTLAQGPLELAGAGSLVRGNIGGGTTGDPNDARYLTQTLGDARYLQLSGGTLTGGLTGTTFTGTSFTASGTSQLANLRMGSSGSFGGGNGALIAFTNATTVPNANPNAAVMYCENNTLKVRQANGAIIVIQNTLSALASTAQNVTVTAQTASTQLVIAVEANTTYLLRGCLVIQSPAGVSFTHGFTGPSGATMIWGDSVATSFPLISSIDTWSGSGANKTAMLTGSLITTGTAGNLTVTFASGTAGQTATLGAGSWISLERR
jgi:hypothetical protein